MIVLSFLAANSIPTAMAVAPATVTLSPYWAGFVNGGTAGTVIKVDGSWIVPAVICVHGTQHLPLNSTLSFEVGIDGLGTKTVENGVGTTSACFNGTPYYYAWYSVGGVVTNITDTVNPGDVMNAVVRLNCIGCGGAGTIVTEKLSTTGWNFSTLGSGTHDPNATGTWAVWVLCCGPTLSRISDEFDSGRKLTGASNLRDAYNGYTGVTSGSYAQLSMCDRCNSANPHILATAFVYSGDVYTFYAHIDRSR